jgi:carnitine-CoA ligase
MTSSRGTRHDAVRRHDRYSRAVSSATILEALDEQVRRRRDEPFILVGDRSLSFGEVQLHAHRIAGGLAALGLPTGGRVAYLSQNRPELIGLGYGIASAGMVTVPLNVQLVGEFLRHQLVDAEISAVAVDASGLQVLVPFVGDLHHVECIIVLDAVPPTGGLSVPVVDFGDLLGHEPIEQPHRPAPEDTALILYTSGTTGPAKGCVLSHRYMVRVGNTYNRLLDIGDDDVQICVLPMFHMSGQMDLMMALLSGTPISVESRFSASRFLSRAREVGATFWAGIGSTVDLLLKQEPKADDFDNPLQKWIGVPLSDQQASAAAQRFGIQTQTQLFAQTEANPVSASGADMPADRGTDGRVLEDIEVRIVDDNENDVPTGEVGEILLRPRAPGAVFSGYWAGAGQPPRGWEDGWHHTGDLGTLDDKGQLRFVDRKKDSMRRKGENISALELDRALLGFEAFAEVATHGVSVDGELEQHIKVCVVLRDGAQLDLSEFGRFVAEAVPHFAVPRYIEVFDQLPRNPIGRVQKFELRRNPLSDNTIDLFALGHTSDRRPDRQANLSNLGGA